MHVPKLPRKYQQFTIPICFPICFFRHAFFFTGPGREKAMTSQFFRLSGDGAISGTVSGVTVTSGYASIGTYFTKISVDDEPSEFYTMRLVGGGEANLTREFGPTKHPSSHGFFSSFLKHGELPILTDGLELDCLEALMSDDITHVKDALIRTMYNSAWNTKTVERGYYVAHNALVHKCDDSKL